MQTNALLRPKISIVVPTRNEAGNINPLLSRIDQATQGISAEVIFVDDSTDETPLVIRCLEKRFCLQVILIARPPERRGNGLGGAVVEGLRIARAPWVCVMDADLQHPPELIPHLLAQAMERGADIVVGSRLARGGDVHSLGPRRTIVSHALALTTRAAFPMRLREVTDPLSGLFLVRREALDLDCLRPDGFKILLEILVRCPSLSVSEIPIHFGYRQAGESKASVREVLRYFRLLLRLRLAGESRFVSFISVGASGLLVNSLLLAFATEWLNIHYLVSVALATMGSTSWNFVLTELWVFRDRSQIRGRYRRLGWFFLMNNAALILRGPIIFLLTSALGVHYLVSNLLSMAAVSISRYLLADSWIWRKAGSGRSSGASRGDRPGAHFHSVPAKKEANMPTLHNYNIHGILTVVSDAGLPELEPFRSHSPIEGPSVRVHLGGSSLKQQPSFSDHRHLSYDEGLGGLGFRAEILMGDSIEVWASPLLRWSPHVLYTNLVEPILRWAFVEKGYALVHGACVDFGGRAYIITARTDTGKTTSLLKILSRQRRESDRSAFIADDLTLISPGGKVLTYPKPLTISRHTVQAINARFLTRGQRLALHIQSRVHSRTSRRVAHSMSRTRLPMATINAVVQFLIPPPKFPVQKLVPQVKLASESKLAGMFIIERSSSSGELRVDPDQALEILVSNCEDAYGFPPYEAIKGFLYGSTSHDLQLAERQIMTQALQDLDTVLIRSTDLDWWRRIPAIVDENLAVHFREPARTKSKPRLRPFLTMAVLRLRALARQMEKSAVTPLRRFSDSTEIAGGALEFQDTYLASN